MNVETLQSMNILYLEDDDLIRESLSRTLSLISKNVYSFATPIEAINHFDGNYNEIDLVVTDLLMPKMNGFEFIQTLREDNHKMPVFVTTAFNEKEYYQKAIDLGVQKFLEKPLSIKELVEEIQKTLTQLLIKKEKEKEELKTLNSKLQEMVDKELERIKEQEEFIYQQQKLASMGEMIGNIAHQWRQPLNVISIVSSSVIFKNDQNTLEKNDINKYMETITAQTQYLSKTINDFRNFIKGEHQKETVAVQELINYLVNITDPSLKNAYVNLHIDIDPTLSFDVYENDLVQGLINIINNAKDVLEEKDPSIERLLFIRGFKEDEKVVITIKDNGGGIPENIINKIFEPYFTTKHQSVGTGLGLAMTYRIVTQMHGGEIRVVNQKYIYDGNEYNGACFRIIL